MVERFGDDYVAVGPWLLSQQNVRRRFDDDPSTAASPSPAAACGVPVRVGRWRIPGGRARSWSSAPGCSPSKDAILRQALGAPRRRLAARRLEATSNRDVRRAAGIVVERWWRERCAPYGSRAVAVRARVDGGHRAAPRQPARCPRSAGCSPPTPPCSGARSRGLGKLPLAGSKGERRSRPRATSTSSPSTRSRASPRAPPMSSPR